MNNAFIIVSHGNFATGALETLEMLVGPTINWKAIGLFPGEGLDDFKEKIMEAVNYFDSKNIMIFSDLQGGTPSNACVQIIMEKNNIEVLSGFNLPLLLEVYSQSHLEISEISKHIYDNWKDYLVNINEKIRGIE